MLTIALVIATIVAVAALIVFLALDARTVNRVHRQQEERRLELAQDRFHSLELDMEGEMRMRAQAEANARYWSNAFDQSMERIRHLESRLESTWNDLLAAENELDQAKREINRLSAEDSYEDAQQGLYEESERIAKVYSTAVVESIPECNCRKETCNICYPF